MSVRTSPFNFTDPVGTLTPFNHTNIVLFTDALCGSSCASIYEEFKNNIGVQTVVVGGRSIKGPMQAVSGTKGGEVIPVYWGVAVAQHMKNLTAIFDLETFPADDTTLDSLLNTPQLMTRAGDDFTRIQVQLATRKGDKSGVPLQYVYEAADCKIFYSYKTFAHPDAAWKAAWDAHIYPDMSCVEGSTGHKSSVSGGFKPYGPWAIKDEDMPVPQGAQVENNGTAGEGEGEAKEDEDKDDAGVRVGASAMGAVLVAVVVAVLQI